MTSRVFLDFSADATRDGRPFVEVSGLRFHLAESRIREFLMGENLYGDTSLAIREAYQNALDACRLAQARREFLGRSRRQGSADSPEIEFVQGLDADGRAYVDCFDRGAGMGIEELSSAFCHAGVRASDLESRAAEAAEFAAADPPVELWQNSRFGIGVMSYFMIADAVSVLTARLERDGSLGNLLSMDIAGPAESFDIVNLGAARSHGTRVRLWLKPSAQISAVSTLRDLVITCPVHLRASDERGLTHRWVPDALNSASTHVQLRPTEHVCAIPGTLWWVSGHEGGGVLADGIWAGTWLPGLIIDLRGPHAPRLTADRQRIIDVDLRGIAARCAALADSAVESAWHLVGDPEWLMETTMHLPVLADAVIASAAKRDDRPLLLHGILVDVTRSGFMPGDRHHDAFETKRDLLAWRLARLTAGGLYSRLGLRSPDGLRVQPARPTDAILLGTVTRVHRFDETGASSNWFPNSASIYEAERHLRYPVQAIVERARQLGLPVRDDAEDLPDSNDVVRTALSFSRREDAGGEFRPLSTFDLVRATWRLGIGMSEVIAELDARFIEFEESARSLRAGNLTRAQLISVSRGTDGTAPWLASWKPVELDHVVRASRAAGRPCSEIVDLMAGLGFVGLPQLELSGLTPSDDDVRMLSIDLDGEGPFLRSGRVWRTSHLRKAARVLERPEDELEHRFAEFGVVFSADPDPDPERSLTKKRLWKELGLSRPKRKLIRSRHLRMMSRDGDGAAPWFDPSEPVPAWTVATLALHKSSIDRVIADYLWLGYTVDDPRTTPMRSVPGAVSDDQARPRRGAAAR